MILTSRAFALLGLCSLLLVFGFVTPWIGGVGLALDGVVLLLAAVDAARARRTPLAVARDGPSVGWQGEAVSFEVAVVNPGLRPVRVAIRQVLDPRLSLSHPEGRGSIPAGGRLDWRFTLTPRRRGRVPLSPVALRVAGPWDLAAAPRLAVPDGLLRVFPRRRYPDEVGLVLRQVRERRLGSHPLQVRGISSELYALREYQPGDPYRSLHWKATARFQRPITREDTWEQHQRIVLLVDCGRTMAAVDGPDGGAETRLDHTLAAVLALLQVVVAHHDTATLVLFSREVRCILKVETRSGGVAPLFERLHEEEADLTEPDYAGVAAWVSRQVQRRSLAILCTAVPDLVTARDLGRAVRALAVRHRTLLVNLEDPALDRQVTVPPDTVEGAFALVSALGLQQANRALATRLGAEGIDVLSVPAAGLALGLVRRYLEIKERRGA